MTPIAEVGLVAAAVGVIGLAGFGYWLKQMQDITQELILRRFRRPRLRRVA
jgi:hypothetical protein